MTAWRYKTFLVSHRKIFHERVVQTLVKYFSTPKEKFISQCGHVIFYLLYYKHNEISNHFFAASI